MKKDNFTLAQYKFIIMALVGFLVYTQIPDKHTTILNIVNAISSLLLITGLFDVVLKQEYLQQLSQHIINGFFAKKDSIKNIPKHILVQNINNMLDVLSDSLHDNLKEKFKYRVSTYFINIFNSDSNEKIHTFYKDYNLKIKINKKEVSQNYCSTTYDLSYTLVNNSNTQINHDIFKVRGFNKELIDENILSVNLLKIKIDNKDIEEIDINTLKMIEVPLPIEATTNNIDNIICLTIGTENTPYKVKFNKELQVTKQLTIKIPKKDILYKCHFNRLATNAKITFIDKNAKNIHILNSFAFIEKKNIDIEDIDIDTKQITINDLVFPKDAISFISER